MTWRPKLLVVDDEPDMLPLVRRLAAHVGFDVVEFRDGAESARRLSAQAKSPAPSGCSR